VSGGRAVVRRARPLLGTLVEIGATTIEGAPPPATSNSDSFEPNTWAASMNRTGSMP